MTHPVVSFVTVHPLSLQWQNVGRMTFIALDIQLSGWEFEPNNKAPFKINPPANIWLLNAIRQCLVCYQSCTNEHIFSLHFHTFNMDTFKLKAKSFRQDDGFDRFYLPVKQPVSYSWSFLKPF